DDWSVSVERVEQVLAHTGAPEPDRTPVTTIAWRLAHLHVQFAGGWEWTFGERRQDPKLSVDFTPSAASALDRFWPLIDRWRDSVADVTDEQLDTVGFSQYPYGSAPDDPFVGVLSGANLEFIHHMAEIALLRDLWRARSSIASQS
ncbi:DinB family protein, partial [Streptomyces scabiei]|uniref:DinB family protein n=1 Tax=Streptomyces scabiei TaxID=1930 RepID=UPI000A6FBBED